MDDERLTAIKVHLTVHTPNCQSKGVSRLENSYDCLMG